MFLAMTVLIWVVALAVSVRGIILSAAGQRTSAIVRSFEIERDGSSQYSLAVIEFRAGERTVSFRRPDFRLNRPLCVGDRVPVLYRAGNPDDVEIDDPDLLYHGMLGLAAFGSLPGVIGCLFLFTSRRPSWTVRK
jgi:hypothetical protein